MATSEILGCSGYLRRRGIELIRWARGWKCLCPLHEDSDPSFTIYVDEDEKNPIRKESYYCYGCRAGGDVYSLVRSIEGCSFGRAVEIVGSPPPEVRSARSVDEMYRTIMQSQRYVTPEMAKAIAFGEIRSQLHAGVISYEEADRRYRFINKWE